MPTRRRGRRRRDAGITTRALIRHNIVPHHHTHRQTQYTEEQRSAQAHSCMITIIVLMMIPHVCCSFSPGIFLTIAKQARTAHTRR